jgi:deoxycytidylate deaminase
MLIQVGIRRIVYPNNVVPDRWKEEFEISTNLLREANVDLVVI